MTAEVRRLSDPPGYPREGSFADLLLWHLYVWGTHPAGNTKEFPKKIWGKQEFFKKVFRESGQDSAVNHRNYRNWIGERDKFPPSEGNFNKICEILFGDEASYEVWKNDFKEARRNFAGKGNNIAKISVADALSELINAGFQRGSSVYYEVSVGNLSNAHFAAQARENVGHVIEGLASLFSGRRNDISAVDKFVKKRMDGGAEGLMVITAPAGYGKSALAAHWCLRSDHPPNRRIAFHFCATRGGRATTSPDNIHANLHRQVAAIFNEPNGPASSADTLTGLLTSAPPDGAELVIWLDGIDEAEGAIECFLPRQLGERICVIVSARANKGVIPAYLAPWLLEGMALGHKPYQLPLEKLPFDDVIGLVRDVFRKDGRTPPKGLEQRIFNASEQGHAIFVRIMAEDALKAIKEGREIDLGEAPESLRGYAESELRRLAKLPHWSDSLQPLFAFLTIAREAVRVEQIPRLIGGAHVHIDNYPDQFRRWLYVEKVSGDKSFPLLGFAHPLLGEMFALALGYQSTQAHQDLCDQFISGNIMPDVFLGWPEYALRHVPHHLLVANRHVEAANLLANTNFIAARFAALGEKTSPVAMATDWMAFYAENEAYRLNDEFLRHIRFWNNYSLIPIGVPISQPNPYWHQLMHDVGLASAPAHAALVHPQPHALARSLATLGRPEGAISEAVIGALVLENGTGFLSWGHDRALRLWGAGGNLLALMTGEEDELFDGAIALKFFDGFLSWGDRSLYLWGAKGEKCDVLRGHDGFVTGALETGMGILSWSVDGTLRLWNFEGQTTSIMSGHRGVVLGALYIESNSTFLSWSEDGDLRLWGQAGEALCVLAGHAGPVSGALLLADNAGFVSWSYDCTLRLWGNAGEKRSIMHGHKNRVQGALILKNEMGFVSWSWDETLRLWGVNGEERAVMCGHKLGINGAIEIGHEGHILSWDDYDVIRRWDHVGNILVEMVGHDSPVAGVLALDTDSRSVSWGLDGAVVLWGANGERLATLRGHEGAVVGVRVLENEAGLLSWSRDGTLRLWGAIGEGYVPADDLAHRAEGALSLGNGSGFLSWGLDATLRLWDADCHEVKIMRGHKYWVGGALILNDGSGFISWSGDGTLRTWDRHGNQIDLFLGHDHAVEGALLIENDGGVLSWDRGGTMRLWDLQGRERNVMSGHPDGILGALALQDEAGFLSWDLEGTLRLWKSAEESQVLLKGESQSWGRVSVLDNGDFLTWGWHDDALRLWNADGSQRLAMHGHKYRVYGAISLHEGMGFLSWDRADNLFLWDKDGKLSAKLTGHESEISGALPLDHNRGFLLWDTDGLIHFWNPEDERYTKQRGHFSAINGMMKLENDGGFLSWSSDGELARWDFNLQFQNRWISPSGSISHVECHGENDQYLVIFGESVGIVKLS